MRVADVVRRERAVLFGPVAWDQRNDLRTGRQIAAVVIRFYRTVLLPPRFLPRMAWQARGYESVSRTPGIRGIAKLSVGRQ